MRKPDFSHVIPILSAKTSDADRIQQLENENSKLRQFVDELANTLALQKELIQQLKDENARLKGQKPKPKIGPSKLEGPNSKSDWRKRIGPCNNPTKRILFFLWAYNAVHLNAHSLNNFSNGFGDPILSERSVKISQLARRIIKKIKRAGKPGQPPGKSREKKKTVLEIHEKLVIQPNDIPAGAQFKGFNRYTVQDIVFAPHTIQYQLARWRLPNGKYITGELPKNIQGHYGPKLIAYILHQYHACRVTEHLLLEQLRARGILISAGQLSNLLIENKDSFVEEVKELLPAATRVEGQIQTDDTGGRHDGKNQYTTIIGNRWFSVFATTGSKSRINFLTLLQGGKEEYVINEDTLEYLSKTQVRERLSSSVFQCLGTKITSTASWNSFLKERNIRQDAEVRFLTEAALYASLIQNGIPKNLGVHGDDARQFDVFVRSLCWVHEERHYRKLIMTTEESRVDLERVKDQIWAFYEKLKQYKKCPTKIAADRIRKEFDDVFQQNTGSPTLNHQLMKTHEKKEKLLRVLARAETPLHNNSSETCARAAKIKLKISGGTRSSRGQKARDVFLSLKQTCRKLGINFISFLEDRVCKQYVIPRLAETIRKRALAAITGPPILFPRDSLNEAASPIGCAQFVG